uniref:Uncharacterized protein n=1 Tax=Arundo donax TaxID=35708 RepID=A0A0A9C9I4_ARUDO
MMGWNRKQREYALGSPSTSNGSARHHHPAP